MRKKKDADRSGRFSLSIDLTVVRRGDLEPVALPWQALASLGATAFGVIDRGVMQWSRPGPGHLLQLGTAGFDKPAVIAERCAAEISAMDAVLAPLGFALLPTSAHPWLDPSSVLMQEDEMDRFERDPMSRVNAPGLRLELPFADDPEFARLHTAVRMILPVLPAISASSPFLLGRHNGQMDRRAFLLMDRFTGFPQLSGQFVPECVLGQEDYYRVIYEPIARGLAAMEPQPRVDYQTMNGRAVTAHFDRNVLAIHVVGVQECIRGAMALMEITTALVNAMVRERWTGNYLQRAWHESDLSVLLQRTAREGGRAVIDNRDFLLMFGLVRENCTAQELWQHLLTSLQKDLSADARSSLEHIVTQGSLAERIIRRTGPKPTKARIAEVYHELRACLAENRLL